MTSEQFLRRLRKACRQDGRTLTVSNQGAGSHRTVLVTPGGRTTLKQGEISPVMKAIMLKQLRLPKDFI